MMENKKHTIEIMQNSLLVNNNRLVFSDLHLGYEDILAGKGIFPRSQLKDTIGKLNSIFFDLNMRGVRLKQIIICGDLKHEFGEISDAEWRETLKVLEVLTKQCNEIILVKGNHDNILGPIANKKEIKLVDHYRVGDICFLHGDILPLDCLEESKILIMGHLHPAISLADGYKKEKYKCFLKGMWKRKQVFVLPSFSELSIGYDLTKEHTYKPKKSDFFIIPESKLNSFDAIIYNDKERKEYNFGKLKKLIKN